MILVPPKPSAQAKACGYKNVSHHKALVAAPFMSASPAALIWSALPPRLCRPSL